SSSSDKARGCGRHSPSASSRSASAWSARSRSTRRRSRRSRSPQSATSAGRSCTTGARKWERRRASARLSWECRYPRRVPRTSSRPRKRESPEKSRLPKKLPRLSLRQKSRWQPSKTSQRLLRFDRSLGARFVAGADEAGRGSLAGPLVVAGVLLDYESLREHRVRPLAQLNDSKQVSAEAREELFRAVVASAAQISVQVIPPAEIDRAGLHRSNLAGLRRALAALTPPAEACLVDGFRLGPSAPEHVAVVDGDERSAAIAAASIVAKVVRDRTMWRLD